MRCNLLRINTGVGNLLLSKWRVAYALLAVAILTTIPLFSQSTLQQPTQASKPTPSSTLPTSKSKSVFDHVNELADLSRAGNADATRELTRQVFRNGGIPSEIADSFGFTDRIVQAESAYRNGSQAPVHEADIVKAINNLVSAVGAPAWVRTNQVEVRKARMRLLVAYPRLIASQEPPDDNGHYKPLSENMRPVEAAYVAITLLYQKHYNADFQFTDEEQSQNAKLDSATVNAKHLERTHTFGSLVGGQSSIISVRDLQSAAGYFFDDLGISQVVNTDSAAPSKSSGIASQKGASR